MVKTVTTVEGRNRFSELINRVAFGKERILLTRRSRKIVALVPIDDLARLEMLDKPRTVCVKNVHDLVEALKKEMDRA